MYKPQTRWETDDFIKQIAKITGATIPTIRNCVKELLKYLKQENET